MRPTISAVLQPSHGNGTGRRRMTLAAVDGCQTIGRWFGGRSGSAAKNQPPVPGQTAQRERRSVNGFSILVAVLRIAAQELLREIRAVIGFKCLGVTLRTQVGLLLHRPSPVRFLESNNHFRGTSGEVPESVPRYPAFGHNRLSRTGAKYAALLRARDQKMFVAALRHPLGACEVAVID